MLEKEIEKYLVKRMKEIGGECYKWSSPGNRGVPDRICIFPSGKVVFVELKAPGKKPTALQLKVGSRLAALSQEWTVVDSIEKVDIVVTRHGPRWEC